MLILKKIPRLMETFLWADRLPNVVAEAMEVVGDYCYIYPVFYGTEAIGFRFRFKSSTFACYQRIF